MDLSQVEGGVVVIEDQGFNKVEEHKVSARSGPIFSMDYTHEVYSDHINANLAGEENL